MVHKQSSEIGAAIIHKFYLDKMRKEGGWGKGSII